MRLLNINGRLTSKNVSKYLIKWDAPSRSKIQFKIKQFFKPYWFGQIIYEEFPVYGSLLKVDILNATRRIAIEVHGAQHEHHNPFFHRTKQDFLNSVSRDLVKHEWLTKNKFKIIEIYEHEIGLVTRAFVKEKFDLDL